MPRCSAALPSAFRFAFAVLALAPLAGHAAQITVDVTQDRLAVSPYLYGKNGGLSHDAQQPLKESDWQFLRDSGVRMLRELGGNNGTKYNWQKKLSSHPDWYNNVYANDWDFAQTSLQQHLPGVQGLWCFQLIGKVADNTTHNFDDWNYNHSQWWSGVAQNLAGGGTLNPASGATKALKEGNTSLYLADSSAATSTAILDHWIKTADLGLDRSQFLYWNMDNEPEIWDGTHDDVMPTQPSAEAFLQRYFDYAKQARARFPEIKLMGPVPANEWQWFNYAGSLVTGSDGHKYPWLEYFIKRVAEEQSRTGIRLLDVLDIHYYPAVTDPASVVQLHRTFFDTTFVNPDANGVHAVNGGWDTSITQEYIFGRCQQWLEKYLGANHGVTLALSETGIGVTNAPIASVWYASTLGEFMKHGVEVFTPWSWQPGMWEVLHLFARYNYTTSVRATSDDETAVSAYATSDATTGNLTVVLVNRDLAASKSATVSLAGTSIPDANYTTLQLASLPSTETFVSHTQNALRTSSVAVAGQRFSLTLPPLSITSVQLRPQPDVTPTTPPGSASRLVNLSVRARGGSGDDVLIVGFVLNGSGSKRLVLRGVGPGLKDLGIPAPMADPSLELHGTPALITNDNWGTGNDTAEFAALFSQVGAFGLTTTSLDAALAPTLAPGLYSVHVKPKDIAGGIAMGEVYETDATNSARLVNVSARTRVGTGDDVLIAGFVINGPANKKVLIRAVGPRLAAPDLGVPGVLADPVLRVYRHGVALPLFQNDNWSSTAYADQIATTAHAIGAFALSDDSKDATLLLTLPPDVYSAIASGVGDTTGVAMVEVYEVE